MKTLLPVLVIFSAILAAGCSDKAPVAGAAGKSVPVAAFKVTRSETPRLCEAPGTVVPRERALVSARVAGTVALADFAIGQKVAAGEILVTLSAPEMEARVHQAQAALDRARRDYERESSLLAGGAATQETVHDMTERLRMAEAALAEAQALASYTKIPAPFPGRITRKMASVGDFAAPGTPLFEIDGVGALRVEATLPESFPEAELGTKLTVLSDGAAEEAILAESSPAADTRSRTRLVKADLSPASGLRPGQFVRLLWPVGTMPEVLIPAGAVTRFGQMERVFLVEGSRAKLRLVRTGEAHGDSVQILSGLAEGDKVILDPPSDLANNSPVEVK
jgi:RND family efflux transporter MFP subunit